MRIKAKQMAEKREALAPKMPQHGYGLALEVWEWQEESTRRSSIKVDPIERGSSTTASAPALLNNLRIDITESRRSTPRSTRAVPPICGS